MVYINIPAALDLADFPAGLSHLDDRMIEFCFASDKVKIEENAERLQYSLCCCTRKAITILEYKLLTLLF